MSAQECVSAGGVCLPECVSARGVCLPGGVSAGGVCLLGVCVYWGVSTRHPPSPREQNDRQV